MSRKPNAPNNGQAARRRELLDKVDDLSPDQLSDGVQETEHFSAEHLASRQRQDRAKEVSEVSRAKRLFVWWVGYVAVAIVVALGVAAVYLLGVFVWHLSLTPANVGGVLASVFSYLAVAGATLFIERILRKDM